MKRSKYYCMVFIPSLADSLGDIFCFTKFEVTILNSVTTHISIFDKMSELYFLSSFRFEYDESWISLLIGCTRVLSHLSIVLLKIHFFLGLFSKNFSNSDFDLSTLSSLLLIITQHEPSVRWCIKMIGILMSKTSATF